MSKKKQVLVLEKNLEALADNVAVISELGKMIEKSRLQENAIILLLQHMTKVNKRDIMLVLSALPKLEQEYLKQNKS